jgi:lipopolysaccharide/colanic/teichoic acid biosynthesis glycosyltransferase
MLLAALSRRARGRAMQVWMGHMPGIVSRDEFHRLLARERARSDRNSHAFSLVVFRTSGAPSNLVRRVAELLRDQRRLTDDVGWVDPPDLGVLLPDTPAAGARRFAEKMHAVLQKGSCDVEDRIYTYQGNSDDSSMWAPPPRSTDRGQAEAATGSPAALVEPQPANQVALAPTRSTPIVRVEDLRTFFLKPLPTWKRAMDIVLSALMLLILAPVYAAVAIAVHLSGPGPIIFRQPRAGPGGKPFTFYKFRTMVPNAEALKATLRVVNEAEGPVFKMRNDPRVTSVGRVLRRTSLDELPQLWNVLKGDMSLVGPRPPTLDEIPSYEPWQNRRLELTGGITGIWQTSGRHQVGFTDWMRMDVQYSNHRSLGMDVKLLAKTVWAVFSGRGAS